MGAVLLGLCLWLASATSLPVADPAGAIKPEFTDLSVGVLLTTAASGNILKEASAFENRFVGPWRAYLDTNNAVLRMSEPTAPWDGPTPPPMVRWACASPIRDAWNITDAEVKGKLTEAFRQYHRAVWSAPDGSAQNIPCTIIGMGAPLSSPGDAFTDVEVARIPAEGPIVEFQIRLVYD